MDGVVKLSRLGLLPHRALRLHLKPDLVANRPYLDLFDRHMTFVDYPVSSMERSRLTLTEQKLNMIRTTVGPLFVYQACALAEQRWLEQRLPPVLTLPPAYRDLARAKLTPLGLRDDRWFVTLHLRGSRYRAEPADVTRNASLSAYSLAIRQIVDAGGQVVLLGEPGMDVPRGLASILVDYANHPRRDPRIDLFLCSDCRFFLGTSSGISHVPGTFGVPAIFSNVSPAFSRPWRRGDIWLPKMLLSNITGRPLRLADLMTPPVSMLGNFSAQKAIGVTAVDNDPEDVCCAVEDMLERLENPLRTPLDDIQERCRKLLSISGYESSLYASQISARFARRHAAALEI